MFFPLRASRSPYPIPSTELSALTCWNASLPKTYLGVPDKLHCPPLVGRESSNLPDNALDDSLALRGLALALAGLGLGNAALSLVAAVDTPDEAGALDSVLLVVRVRRSARHFRSIYWLSNGDERTIS